MKNEKKLLFAAYVLMAIAVSASLALFCVQTVEKKAAERDCVMLRQQLEEQEQIFQEQMDELADQVGQCRQKMTQTEQLYAALQEELVLAQQETARNTLDIRDCSAGDILRAEQIDAEHLEQYFTCESIVQGDAVYQRIYEKSYVDNEDIGLDELCYLKVLHYNFAHEIQVGELVVNRALALDYQEIFLELFENEYEINSMFLIDNYWTGDGVSSDHASIEANNTSAFCYRRVVGGSGGLSNHALGRAIDINPQQNPYVTYKDGKAQWAHENADEYIDRDSGLPHVITHDDLCYQLFQAHGFDWGGDWKTVKDYQHFDKER